MARGIPSLEPDGIRSVAVRGHRPRDKTPRRYRPESERLAAEPWRSSGYGQEYRRARELCIDRARGRCERCGRTVAVKSRGKWKVEGGEVPDQVLVQIQSTADKKVVKFGSKVGFEEAFEYGQIWLETELKKG